MKESALWLLNILFPENELEETVRTLTQGDIAQKIQIKTAHDITYFFNYRDPLMRKMIWMLKYKGDTHVAKLLADVLNDYLLEELSDIELFDKEDVLLLPIPLSRARRRTRGFNQIELVLNNMKNDYEVDEKSLLKTKNTAPQTEIKKKEERAKNIVGAFSITNPERVKNKHIILIDDVTTTGSTLKEASKVLHESGARSVRCISFAH